MVEMDYRLQGQYYHQDILRWMGQRALELLAR